MPIQVVDSGVVTDLTNNTCRVLVIDDDTDVGDALRDVLSEILHVKNVLVAHSGAEGLKLARDLVPDLVLCDVSMPGMDGYAVARAFRVDPTLRRSRLVALSGFGRPEDLRRAADAGFEQTVEKPPAIEEIEKLLHVDCAC